RHLFQCKVIDAKDYGDKNKNAYELSHIASVDRERDVGKAKRREGCQRNTPGEPLCAKAGRLLDSWHAVFSGSFLSPCEKTISAYATTGAAVTIESLRENELQEGRADAYDSCRVVNPRRELSRSKLAIGADKSSNLNAREMQASRS